jgi:hypothetical protein
MLKRPAYLFVLLLVLSTSAFAQNAPTPRAQGEFARLMTIPAACQTARELGQSQLLIGRLSEPGPTCHAVVNCFTTLRSQIAKGIEYLKNNPGISDAFRRQVEAENPHNHYDSLLNSLGAMAGDAIIAALVSNRIDDRVCSLLWYQLNTTGQLLSFNPAGPWEINRNLFGRFSAAGQALLSKVRTQYTADEVEYNDLIASNDRYTGVEAFERAYAAYHQAFEDDDLAGMLRERLTFLKELEVAKTRNDLLTQQSARIATYLQMLSDITASIQHEGLAEFLDRQMQMAIDDLQTELQQLNQTAPGKRGDIAASLEIIATRIRDIDTAITSGRTVKSQAELTRRTLVENEGAARRVLEAATSADLTPAFDEQFVTSVKALVDQFRELDSIELWAIKERQVDIAAATRKLEELQQQVPDAQVRFDQATRLDGVRRSVILRLSAALSEFLRPQNHDKLSPDGLRIVSVELKSQLDALSGLDRKPLLARPDYRGMLAASDETLGRIAQIKAEITQIAELTSAQTALIRKIDARGRSLLDASTSTQLLNLNDAIKALNAAGVPLTPENRSKLARASETLGTLERTVEAVMDREEQRITRENREAEETQRVWRARLFIAFMWFALVGGAMGALALGYILFVKFRREFDQASSRLALIFKSEFDTLDRAVDGIVGTSGAAIRGIVKPGIVRKQEEGAYPTASRMIDVGAFFLLVGGLFMPIVRFGFRTMSLVDTDAALIVAGAALAGLFAALARYRRIAGISAIVYGGVFAVFVLRFYGKLEEMREQLQNNPFRGLAEAMIGLEWGCAVIAISVLAVLFSTTIVRVFSGPTPTQQHSAFSASTSQHDQSK